MKTKVLLSFPAQLANNPITYELVKRYDLKINILKASIGYNIEGMLLLELEGSEQNITGGIDFLNTIGIKVDPYHTKITIREKDCVNCGACTSVCPSGALSMDDTSWTLAFEAANCLGCNLCVNSCPLRALEPTI